MQGQHKVAGSAAPSHGHVCIHTTQALYTPSPAITVLLPDYWNEQERPWRKKLQLIRSYRCDAGANAGRFVTRAVKAYSLLMRGVMLQLLTCLLSRASSLASAFVKVHVLLLQHICFEPSALAHAFLRHGYAHRML